MLFWGLRTYFLTTILIHPDFENSLEHDHDIVNDKRNDNVNDKRNDNITLQNQIPLTKRAHDVLRELQEDNTLTIAQLAQKAGVSSATISRIIKELKDKHLIERVGASKNGKKSQNGKSDWNG